MSVVKPLDDLNENEVVQLLKSLHLEQYVEHFLKEHITGNVLAVLESETEVKELLGVDSALKARVLFRKISEFKSGGVPFQNIYGDNNVPTGATNVPITAATNSVNSDKLKLEECVLSADKSEKLIIKGRYSDALGSHAVMCKLRNNESNLRTEYDLLKALNGTVSILLY